MAIEISVSMQMNSTFFDAFVMDERALRREIDVR
jgi:hypothetical protein